jgi:hypothetical protein
VGGVLGRNVVVVVVVSGNRLPDQCAPRKGWIRWNGSVTLRSHVVVVTSTPPLFPLPPNRAVAGDAAFDAAVRAVHPAVLEQMQRATSVTGAPTMPGGATMG